MFNIKKIYAPRFHARSVWGRVAYSQIILTFLLFTLSFTASAGPPTKVIDMAILAEAVKLREIVEQLYVLQFSFLLLVIMSLGFIAGSQR